MKPIVGNVPGWSYEVSPPTEPVCCLCKRDGLPVIQVGGDSRNSICEPCSMLLAWIWRDFSGLTVPGGAYPTDIRFVLVLIVRPRENDFVCPFDVLMVERKDERDAFGLPGGKVEPGEEPAAAAARELEEEVGIRTWPAALEPLYAGYSPRASLGGVYLCRGYEGEPEEGVGPEGQQVAWKPWPPGAHARHLAGFYVGVAQAFDMRWKMHRQVAAGSPLSIQLGEPAVAYLMRRLEQLGGRRRPDDSRMLESYSNVMTAEEKEICEVILVVEKRKLDRAVVASPAVIEKPAEVGEDEGEGEEAGEEEPESETDGNEPPPFDEETGGSGFVRQQLPLRRPPP